MRILIIGGCGYIGSALFTFLKKRKYKVDTVDLEWFGNYVNPKNIKKDYSLLPKSFFKKYSVVILLAGHSNYYMCERDVLGSFKNNVVNFVELLQKLSSQKFIYASTSTLYEYSKEKIATEDSNYFKPLSHYDLTKKIIDDYASLSGKNYYSLRLGTVSGFSPNLRVDLMINKMYQSAIKRKEIKIHNPKNKRSVLGIIDFCRAVETILKKKSIPGIYNLGSFSYSIEHMAKYIAKKIPGVKIKIDSSIPAYESFSLNTNKFEKKFNFKFHDTIDSIVDSLKDNFSSVPKSIRK